MGACGWDYLVVDVVNSALSQLDIQSVQMAIGDASPDTPVLIKVGGPNDRTLIQAATDTGAAGVLVPGCMSLADVQQARSVTLFPTAGTPSFYGPVRAHHRERMFTHILTADAKIVMAVQFEKAPRARWSEMMSGDFHVT